MKTVICLVGLSLFVVTIGIGQQSDSTFYLGVRVHGGAAFPLGETANSISTGYSINGEFYRLPKVVNGFGFIASASFSNFPIKITSGNAHLFVFTIGPQYVVNTNNQFLSSLHLSALVGVSNIDIDNSFPKNGIGTAFGIAVGVTELNVIETSLRYLYTEQEYKIILPAGNSTVNIPSRIIQLFIGASVL